MIRFNDTTLLTQLQTNTKNIRNISILAHVDHGKTTLADSLIASNNIISKGSAGQIRYLDSRQDEQRRGITMKTSCISLIHEREKEKYLINLLDSPGHVDFSSEVSAAAQLSDGALIIICVVEGISAQTRYVLKQARRCGLRCILVLNKIDRLLLETTQSLSECYDKLKNIISEANILMGSLKTECMEDETDKFDNLDKEFQYFDPRKRNVLFVSAIDNMGFRLYDFAVMYADKFNTSIRKCELALWGNCQYDKTKSKFVHIKNQKKTNLFTSFILKMLKEVYNLFITEHDTEKIQILFDKYNIKISANRLKNNNPRLLLKLFFQNWMPLDKSVIASIIDVIPNPVDTSHKIDYLFPKICFDKDYLNVIDSLHIDFKNKKSKNNVAFVSKSMCLDLDALNSQTQLYNIFTKSESKSKYAFLGISRLMSGILKKGDLMFFLGPKYKLLETIQELGQDKYITTQQYLDENMDIPHVDHKYYTHWIFCSWKHNRHYTFFPFNLNLGIGGLENCMIKSGTVSSTLMCPSFTGSLFQEYSVPLMSVVVSPKKPNDMDVLRQGLAILNKSDSAIETKICKNGEYLISACGEVHLNKCIDDLRNFFVSIEIVISEPVVPFRETISFQNYTNAKHTHQICEFNFELGLFVFELFAFPISDAATQILNENALDFSCIHEMENDKLITNLISEIGPWFMDNMALLSIGNKKTESNLLFINADISDIETEDKFDLLLVENKSKIPFFSQLHSAFQMACEKGPLCEEPLSGVAFFISDLKIFQRNHIKPLMFGEIIPKMKDTFLSCLCVSYQRLVIATCKCFVEVETNYL
ncbi:hypothetical protein A3Q56_05327, partial [Intoshia linei]